MKRKGGKILAMMVAATMIFGTVSVCAEELEVLDIENISVEEDASLDELTSIEEDASVDTLLSSGEDEMSGLALFYDETDALSGASVDEGDAVVADEEPDAAVGNTGKAKKLSKEAQKILKSMAGRKKNKNSYAYKHLSKKQQKIYDGIQKEVNRILYDGGKLRRDKYGQISTNVVWKGKEDKANQIQTAVEVYKMDNPQAFFLGDMKNPFTSYKRLEVNLYFTIYKDTNTPAKIRDRAESIAKNLKACKKLVNKQKGDYNKAKKVMGLLCKRLEHGGYEASKGLRGLNSTFYNKRYKGGNNDYAQTFTALARYCGFETYQVHGDEDNQNCNDWNRIKVDGKFYNVDANWCDWADHGSKDELFNENFFLKNNSTINKDKYHYVDKDYKKFVPAAASKNYKPKKK